MNFPSQIFFNDINHGYRAAILKRNYLWLLPFFMVVATYFYHENVRKTMRTATVSNLLESISEVLKELDISVEEYQNALTISSDNSFQLHLRWPSDS